MPTDFINQILDVVQQAGFYLKPWLEFLAALWLFNIGNWLLGSPLNIFGILPRHLFGLIGIFTSPFLHADFKHLFFNTIPLLVLGLVLLASDGTAQFIWLSAVIAVLSGLGVWIFARRGLHIGASSVISGYFGYIIMNAYKNPGVITVITAVLAIYYFGGIFLGIFPTEKRISWEAHLFGFLGGIAAVYVPLTMVHSMFQHL